MTTCPFCPGNKQRALVENEHAYLTYSLAPYHKYHLLVIPKRHVELFKDLKWQEHISIAALLSTGAKTLDTLGLDDCSVVAKGKYKTIPHLHYHIIPGGMITDISLDTEMRTLLSKKDIEALEKELKTQLTLVQ
jgi:diadenosine tetraphosphate (Ap4A) HIT family hydrolase